MARPYRVKELYRTLQGEGGQAGRVAVFCRFTGCNLWSGLERDRARALCRFCDTDFVGTDGPGGGSFDDAGALAAAIERCWAEPVAHGGAPLVVFTGGEPALQLDAELVEACHARAFEVAIETNGTVRLAPGIDWVTVSPKAGTEVIERSGRELKLVWPQELDPEEMLGWDFEHFFLQPMDGGGEMRAESTERAVRYCLEHPRWRLSLQTHKLLGLP